MTIPYRGETGHGIYFITASTFMKQNLLQSERMADLFIELLYSHRKQQKYLLHEFVVMPNHFHLLITPVVTLERAMQFIKGGFSFQAKKRLGITSEIWQTSFYDHRVRDWEEYERFRAYIHDNPVRRGLVEKAEDWPFGPASPRFEKDEVPQRLKPFKFVASKMQA